MPERAAEPEPTWPDLQALLDQELNRLPDRYRLPVVLCGLEGRSRREVARQLNIPEGTLSSRLATGRQLLAKRLARHGLALSGASVAALLAESGASASVPPVLLGSTTKAALLVAAGQTAAAGLVSAKVAALSEGVLRMMFVAKLKTVTFLFSGVAAVGLGTGGLWQAAAGTPSPFHAGPAQAVARADPAQGAGGGPKAEDRQRAADREQELRAQLEKARQEVEALRKEVARLRDRAEVERKLAEDALGKTGRNVAEPAGRAMTGPAPETAPKSSKLPPRDGARFQQEKRTTPMKPPEATRARSLPELEQRRRELLEQLKSLEAEQRKVLEDVKRLGGDPRQKETNKPAVGQQVPVSPDKLERILDRLERLEKRLDRLESSRSPSEKRL